MLARQGNTDVRLLFNSSLFGILVFSLPGFLVKIDTAWNSDFRSSGRGEGYSTNYMHSNSMKRIILTLSFHQKVIAENRIYQCSYVIGSHKRAHPCHRRALGVKCIICENLGQVTSLPPQPEMHLRKSSKRGELTT